MWTEYWEALQSYEAAVGTAKSVPVKLDPLQALEMRLAQERQNKRQHD